MRFTEKLFAQITFGLSETEAILVKLKIVKTATGAKVYDENDELVANIKNKLLDNGKIITNYKDKETFSTLVVNAEECFVYDEDGTAIVNAKINYTEGQTIYNHKPVNTVIEFGEDSYIVERTKSDNLIVERQEVDEDYKEYVDVIGVSKIKSYVESDVKMSITTLIVIYIFAKYMYDSKLTTLV